jgi:hypothetical protein
MATADKPISRFDQPVASFAADDLQTIITALYEKSDSCAYAAFACSATASATGVVLLCGFGERFRTISILRHLQIPCLIVQDPHAPWFTGSRICAGLAEVNQTMAAEFPNIRRWLLVGQSSGAYAALYLSRLVPNSLTIAFAPQTCDDSLLKQQKIFFPPGFVPASTMLATHPIPDLREKFFARPGASTARGYIISAFSEHENPPTAWLWLDAMHWGRLVEHPDITVVVTSYGSHAVLFKNAGKFAAMIGDLAALHEWRPDPVQRLISAVLYAPTPV